MRISFLKSKTPLAGLEPAIFGLEVQRVIHYATRALAYSPETHVFFFFAFSKSAKMTLVGLEPTISGSVDRRLIHWATGPTC